MRVASIEQSPAFIQHPESPEGTLRIAEGDRLYCEILSFEIFIKVKITQTANNEKINKRIHI